MSDELGSAKWKIKCGKARARNFFETEEDSLLPLPFPPSQVGHVKSYGSYGSWRTGGVELDESYTRTATRTVDSSGHASKCNRVRSGKDKVR